MKTSKSNLIKFAKIIQKQTNNWDQTRRAVRHIVMRENMKVDFGYWGIVEGRVNEVIKAIL